MAETGLDIALIGYQDQGNLGMGYLAATAQRQGYSVELFDVREGAKQIAARLAGRSPVGGAPGSSILNGPVRRAACSSAA
jgi:hypothetical protein